MDGAGRSGPVEACGTAAGCSGPDSEALALAAAATSEV